MTQPAFQYEPPLPRRITGGTFIQAIRAVDGPRTIGIAHWCVAAGGEEGVVQLLDLTTQGDAQREGLGTALLDEIVKQATRYFQLRNLKLRRMWMAVEQADQVKGRAFLTNRGFHHVWTMDNLMKSQDVLVYVRSFD